MSEKFENSTYSDHREELKALQKLGFTTNPLNKVVHSLTEAYEYAQEIVKKREDLPYLIDGVVIKINDNLLSHHLGVVGKTPRGWVAMKFAGDEVVTTIRDIEWQVGRTGKITPVAELDPVTVMGTVVKRATLHHVKEVEEMGLCTGDLVVIHKAGDVIPEVKQLLIALRPKNAVPIAIPTQCPSCDAQIYKTETGVDLLCKNSQCEEQVIAKLTYYAQRSIANMVGLSEKTLHKMYQRFGVRDIADLYNLPYEEIFYMEGFGRKAIDNLKKSIEDARVIEAERFFAGLGIEGVGREVAKIILTAIHQDDRPLSESSSQALL